MFNSNDSKASFKHLFTSLVTGYLGTSMAANPSAPKLSGLEKSFTVDGKPKAWTTDDCYIIGNVDKLVIEAVGRGYEVKFPTLDKASSTPSQTTLTGSKSSLINDLCHSTIAIKLGEHPSTQLKIVTTACYLNACTEAFVSQSSNSIEMPIDSDGSSSSEKVDTTKPTAVSKLVADAKFGIKDLLDAAAEGDVKASKKLADTEVIKKLLAAGADVNAPNRYGHTALMCAAESGNAEMVKLLLNAGANINATNNKGLTALIGAAGSNSAETVKILLAAGANINAISDDKGHTALTNAAVNGRMGIIKLLLDAGADINAKCDYGTALMLAARNCHIAAIELLLQAGSDPCPKTKTPACKGAIEVLEADITEKFTQGKISATVFKSCKDKYEEKSGCVIM